MTLGLQGLTIKGGYKNSGAAVECWDMPVQIDNCIFADNVASAEGGAVCVYYGIPRVTGCRFLGNSADKGGAFAALGGAFRLEGCLFERNFSTDGGAVYAEVAYADTISSCTFVANEAARGAGVSVIPYIGATMVLDHCIVAFGFPGEGLFWNGLGTLELSCCDIHGNAGGDWIGAIAEQEGLNGNLGLDPLFCGAQNPDEPYSLAGESPCAPDHNPACGLIGALPVGCSVTDVPGTIGPARLLPCFPNPFNPSTTIRWELTENTRVTVRVLDASGRVVRVLLRNEMLGPGLREMVWNGTDHAGRAVAAGVYFCQLEAGRTRETGRVTLVK